MRRAAGDVEVDRDGRGGTAVLLGLVQVWPAADRACTDRDDDLWGGNGIVGLLQRELHVLSHGAGESQLNEVRGTTWRQTPCARSLRRPPGRSQVLAQWTRIIQGVNR